MYRVVQLFVFHVFVLKGVQGKSIPTNSVRFSGFRVILTVHRRKYVEIKCKLDATEVFIVDLIAYSTCFGHHYAHHQELKSIIQWLLPVVFRAVKM